MTYKDKRLPNSFYERNDVVQIAKELLGKKIYSRAGGILTSGIITETEAYSGTNDKACHAHLGKLTNRTATMYENGGRAYIYLCYGIHHLFNVVTNVEGKADAVLIRAIEPLDGKDVIIKRRNFKIFTPKITAGPGKLSQALGINKNMNGENLITSSVVWIEIGDYILAEDEITIDKRIGIDYAEEDADLLWRFYIKENISVSKY